MARADTMCETRPAPPLRLREKLEVIIDTCSMGNKVTRGISLLVQHIGKADNPSIFHDYRILIPIQLGTEKKQRLFPDFLDAELMTHSAGYLEKFYRQHREHTRIVETDVSLSYKLLYAGKAIPMLYYMPFLKEGIVYQARLLASRYDVVLDRVTSITMDDLNRFCDSVVKVYSKHLQDFALSRREIVAYNLRFGVTRPELLEAIVRSAQQVALSRCAAILFKDCSDAERYLLQAIYEERDLYKTVSEDKEFILFRRDKGERAIESYLYGRNAESVRDRVTLVISEDMGARRNIHRLRTQSQNTVFTISSYGLALALKELKLISALAEIIPDALINEFRAREQPKRVERAKGINNSTMHDLMDPVIERKWAHRLVEVVTNGQWSDYRTRLSKPVS